MNCIKTSSGIPKTYWGHWEHWEHWAQRKRDAGLGWRESSAAAAPAGIDTPLVVARLLKLLRFCPCRRVNLTNNHFCGLAGHFKCAARGVSRRRLYGQMMIRRLRSEAVSDTTH
jgi:hypothetical protein